MALKWLNFAAFLIGLAAVGIGVALKDPAMALVVVGGIIMATVFAVSLYVKPQRIPQQPKKEERKQ